MVLFDLPGVAGQEEVAEGSLGLLGLDLFNLGADTLVIGGAFDIADDTHCDGEFGIGGSPSVGVVAHHGEFHREGEVGVLGVVDDEVVLRDAVFADGDAPDVPAVQDETLVTVLAVNHGFAFLEEDAAVLTERGIGDGLVDAVGKDDAVGQHLHHRSALVAGGGNHALDRVGNVGIDGTGKEIAAGTETELSGAEGVLDRSPGRRLGDESAVGGGGVLTFGEAVDFVVEEDDVEVDVAAHRVDEVVAADSEAVAVAGDVPDGEVGTCGLESGGNGEAATMNGVHAIGLQIVGHTAGASDAGDNGGLPGSHTEFGHRFLHGGGNGVVTASGTEFQGLI